MTDALAGNPVTRAVGWALVQFIWQGVLVGGLAAIVLALLARRPAFVRYWVACAALLVMGALPVVTAIDRASASSSLLVRADQFRVDLDTWLPYAVILWLAGVTLLSLRLLTGAILVQKLRRQGTRPASDACCARVAAIARLLHVTRTVRVLESVRVAVPTVIGCIRPAILLPASALIGLSPAQLEAVLAHELAHVRRHDYAVNLLQTIIETLLFYHPAVWWVSRRIRIEREHCCDDVAVELCGDRVAYAEALAQLEEQRGVDAELALAATGGPLLARIRRLIAPRTVPNERPQAWLAACAVGVVLLLMLVGDREMSASQPAEAKTVANEARQSSNPWLVPPPPPPPPPPSLLDRELNRPAPPPPPPPPPPPLLDEADETDESDESYALEPPAPPVPPVFAVPPVPPAFAVPRVPPAFALPPVPPAFAVPPVRPTSAAPPAPPAHAAPVRPASAVPAPPAMAAPPVPPAPPIPPRPCRGECDEGPSAAGRPRTTPSPPRR